MNKPHTVSGHSHTVSLPDITKADLDLLRQGARASGRSLRNFVKVAAMKQAIHVLEKVKKTKV